MAWAKDQGKLPVRRVLLAWVVEKIESINGLGSLTTQSKGLDVWLPVMKAKTSLREMISASIYSPFLKVSFDRASELFDLLEKHVPHSTSINQTQILSDTDVWEIQDLKEKMTTILMAELGTLPVFLITPKSPYSIDDLLGHAATLFPNGLLEKVPEATHDANESGMCFAFERSTACGFHTFRVVESVLRRYWDHVTNNEERPTPQTLGKMAGDLEKKRVGDEKALNALKQLSNLHRNPIAHPDVVLTMDEARGIIGMSHSVITHMLAVLPVVPLTTSASLVQKETE